MEIEKILQSFKNDEISLDEIVSKFKSLPYEDLEYAKIDYHRSLRNGFSEVIFCPNKSISHICGIVYNMLQKNSKNILLTRANNDIYIALKNISSNITYYEDAKIIVVNYEKLPLKKGKIAVLSAGTADISVAEEAAVTLEVFGNNVERVYDVGVAGIHRLFSKKEVLDEASVLIVVAGMEGALASVVGGLTNKPIIAVPTSVGYGASFNGVAALLAMLNSCASGVCVVNIDNGFGAACSAHKIISLIN